MHFIVYMTWKGRVYLYTLYAYVKEVSSYTNCLVKKKKEGVPNENHVIQTVCGAMYGRKL